MKIRKLMLLAAGVALLALLSASTSMAAHLSDDLVAYWPFDDGTDPTADLAHIYDADLVPTGSEPTFDTVDLAPVPGNVRSLDFDGTNDYAFVADPGGANNLDAFTGLTLAAWINPDTVSGGQAIISKYNTNTNFVSYYLSLRDDELRVFVGESAWTKYAYGTTDSVNLSSGSWVHVAGTWDGAAFKLYVNGTEGAGTDTIVGAFPAAMQDSTIQVDLGAFEAFATGTRSGFFDGNIDEARIYDRALSSDEIAALANFSNFDVSLAPDADINPVGADHTVTATLDPALSFIPVLFEFEAGSANAQTDETVLTDGDGEADLTSYTGSLAGVDTITACIDLDNDGACEPDDLTDPEPTGTVKKYWPDVIAITQNGGTDDVINPINTTHEVVVAVTADGMSVPGAPVLLLVDSALEASGTTNSSGVATLSYSSGVAGVDTLTACLDFAPINQCDGDDLISNELTKFWYDKFMSGGGQILKQVLPDDKRKDWRNITFGGFMAEAGTGNFIGEWEVNFHNVSDLDLNRTKFHTTSIDTMIFHPPPLLIDCLAVTVTATGIWNGIPGYKIDIRAEDVGEPGTLDNIRIQLFDDLGGPVYDTRGNFESVDVCRGSRTLLDHGNLQIDVLP